MTRDKRPQDAEDPEVGSHVASNDQKESAIKEKDRRV
jgi:hypothetical protein